MELAFEVWFSEVSPEKVVRAKGPLSQSPGRWLSSNWGLESPKSWGIPAELPLLCPARGCLGEALSGDEIPFESLTRP